MAWRWIGEKALFEAMLTQFTNAYKRRLWKMSLSRLSTYFIRFVILSQNVDNECH